jgi:hypothetical protein
MAVQRVTRWVGGPSAMAVIIAAGLVIGAASPAQAAKPRPDLQVEISAPRNIIPAVSGWTYVSATVSNIGRAPASNARLTITLPSQLRIGGWTTTEEWPCTLEWPSVLTCEHVGDFAAGATSYPVSFSASTYEAVAGQAAEVTAEATTSSRERDLSNNTASAAIAFVGKGVINGNIWNDLNANGVREAGEPSVSVAQLSFRSVDDEDQYGASYPDEAFYFEVPAKKYYAEAQVLRSQWQFTTPDVGDDTTDSDVTPISDDGFYRTARSAEFVVAADGTVTIDLGVVAVQP